MQTSEAPEVIATAFDNDKAAMQCCIADAYCNVASDFGRVINATPNVGHSEADCFAVRAFLNGRDTLRTDARWMLRSKNGSERVDWF